MFSRLRTIGVFRTVFVCVSMLTLTQPLFVYSGYGAPSAKVESRSAPAADAGNITVWFQLKNSSGPLNPQVDQSGHRVAVWSSGATQVWELQSNGQMGNLVWNSQFSYPKSYFFGRAWIGTSLLLSQTRHNLTPEQRRTLPYEKLEAIRSGKGETVLINVDTGKASQILPYAYQEFSVSPSGKYVAAISPTHVKSLVPIIDFYAYDKEGLKFKILGRFDLREGYIAGWSESESGIYLVSSNHLNPADRNFQRELILATPNNKLQSILSKNTSVVAATSDVLPYAIQLIDGQLSLLVSNLGQSWSIANINTKGIQSVTKWRDLMSLVEPVAPNSQLLCVSPNGQFVLFQDLGKSGELKPENKTSVWAFDTKNKKRRKIGEIGRIQQIYQWSGSKLVVGVQKGEGYKDYLLGLIDFPEGIVAGISFKNSEGSWENAEPTRTALPAAAQVTMTFLKKAEIVPFEFPISWATSFFRPNYLKDLTIYALGRSNIQDDGFVAVDEKVGRVVVFRSPPPIGNMPEIPISPEVAVGKARGFLIDYQPSLGNDIKENYLDFKVDPQITLRAAYIVRVRNSNKVSSSSTLTVVDIEVRASDGKISAYREYTAATINQQKPEPERLRPLITDAKPRFSPDGSKVAFYSNRPRPGVPVWWPGRPYGLFIVNADGTQLQMIEGQAGPPAATHWSPDSRYLSYQAPDGIHVYDAVSKSNSIVPLTKDKNIEQNLWGWLASDKLLLGWLHNGPGGDDLVTWEPMYPLQTPKVQVKDWSDKVGNDYAYGQFALSPDMKTLAFTWRVLEQNSTTQCSYALFTIPVSNVSGQPKKIVPCLSDVAYLRWHASGLIAAGSEAQYIDAISGAKSVWQAPEVLLKTRGGRFDPALVQGCDFSLDGKTVAYVGYAKDERAGKSGNLLLRIAASDGTKTTLVGAENIKVEDKIN